MTDMLAIAEAAAGIDPRPAARRALRLNPLEPLTSDDMAAFRTASRHVWIERSAVVGHEALASKDLAIAPG